MKVKIEVELPEAVMIRECVKVVAEKSPLGLLAQPLFNMINEQIKSAQETENGDDPTSKED